MQNFEIEDVSKYVRKMQDRTFLLLLPDGHLRKLQEKSSHC